MGEPKNIWMPNALLPNCNMSTLWQTRPKGNHMGISISISGVKKPANFRRQYHKKNIYRTSTPRPRILILFQLRRSRSQENGVIFLGVVPFWLHFWNFDKRKCTFWYSSQNFVKYYWPHPKLAPGSCSSLGWNTGYGVSALLEAWVVWSGVVSYH